MGIAVVWLRGSGWPELDLEMERRGFVRHVRGATGASRLPRGVYWQAEPTRAEELLAHAKEAVAGVEPTARIVAVEGAAAWAGLAGLEGE